MQQLPYRKAVTSEGYLVNIVNDYRVIFYYSVDFVNIFADPPMINFWFKTAWESGYFEPHSGGWCLPP